MTNSPAIISLKAEFLGTVCGDIMNRDDIAYEISLLIIVKSKRKSRKKKETPSTELDLGHHE